MHLPILRSGRPYRSLDVSRLTHVATGQPVAEVSQANPGLIGRDLARGHERQRALQELSTDELLAICGRAAELFSTAALPLDGATQSADDYVRQLSSTSGLPETLCRANMEKIRTVLAGMDGVLAGLTRGLDLEVLDHGWGREDGRVVSWMRRTDQLGVVLPSNSPGVHSLWLPSIPLKVPLTLKPGSREPWTPFRIAQAFLAAGCPAEAIGFYPSDHGGATRILLDCGRSMLFGDRGTVGVWAEDPRVELHGPGWSKVLFGEDEAGSWQRHLDLLETSVAANGGRSCINASAIWVPPPHGRAVADALAARLAAIEAQPLEDPAARIAAFSDPRVARRISEHIDRQLKVPGARDLTAEHRGGDRLVERGGCTFLLPTVVWCTDPAHPLAETELLFPYVSVLEVPQHEMAARLGSSLVVTALSQDAAFLRELLDCPQIDRLNAGPTPTCQLSWDQPHEGNLFEHLYRRRSFQSAASA